MREESAHERILGLAATLCMPRWRAAARMVIARTAMVVGFDADAMLKADWTTMPLEGRSKMAAGFAERVRGIDPVLSVAWKLLALRTTDSPTVIHAAVAGATGLLSSADGDTKEARARLRVWDDVARGKYDGAVYDNDFFDIADRYWSGEMQHIVADEEDDCQIVSGIQACVAILESDRWDDAMAWLSAETGRQVGKIGLEVPKLRGERKEQAIQIRCFAEVLFAQRRLWCGELAIAWLAMLCDPRKPDSFISALPQINWMLENWSFVTNPRQRAALHDRIEIWWRAAAGEWTDSEVSIFMIAYQETEHLEYAPDDEGVPFEPPPEQEPARPTVVVMPGKLADERNMPLAWREMRDVALPLVVCNDLTTIRDVLCAEYPHAWSAIGMLLHDLREGQPVRMRPTLLLSPPGFGKSRLVRRLAEVIGGGMYVYRYDGAAAHDGTYGGAAKSWSSAQPSVPARAIMMSGTANPIALVDEVERGGTSTYNGNLWNAMAPFLEIETSGRYRETGLDAEIDLSNVVHIATANSIDPLPAQLRDRYHVIRIPSPTLAHLPALAVQLMRDLASSDETRQHDEPLADDELAIIGRAWAKEKFSIRKLQRLIAATLETRDACARRH